MNNDDNTKSPQNGRRTALKSILVGSGTVTLSALPTKWMKPVVESVVLPAHAQTSPAVGGGGGGGPAGGGARIPMAGARAPSWLDKLVPRAYAQDFPSGGEICISEDGSGGFIASWVDSGGTVYAGGVFSVPGCVVLLCPGRDFGAVLNVTEALSNGRFAYDFRMGSAGNIDTMTCDIAESDVLLSDSGTTSFECDTEDC